MILPKITNRSYNRPQTILTDLHLTKVVCSDLLTLFLDAKNVCARFNSKDKQRGNIGNYKPDVKSLCKGYHFFFPTTETVLKRSYKPYGDVSIIS